MNLEGLIRKIRQYPLVTVFGAISLILIIAILIRNPKVSSLQEINDQREREWTTVRTNHERSAGLEAEVEKLRSFSEEVNRRLISADAIANNYNYFYRIERQTGIRIVNIQQLPVASARRPQYLPELNDFDLVPFNLTFQGSFDVTMTFLQGIERGEHLVRIESISINRDEGTGTSSNQRTLVTRMEMNILGRKAGR